MDLSITMALPAAIIMTAISIMLIYFTHYAYTVRKRESRKITQLFKTIDHGMPITHGMVRSEPGKYGVSPDHTVSNGYINAVR